MNRACGCVLHLFASGALLCSALADTNDFHFAGPTELQDTFLPAQLRYQSYPESARVLRPGGVTANVTVDWTADLARTGTYLFDGETITGTVKLRHSPFEKWEVGLDVPYADRIDGSLDEFVETTLNQKVLDRYELPRDTYQAFIGTTNEAELLLGRGRGFRDVSFRAKYQFLDTDNDQPFDAAAVVTMAFPTGNTTFGGEGFSPGMGLHFQKPLEHFNYFTGVAATYYTDATEQQFRLHHWRGMGYGGFEFRPWKNCASVLEYQIYSPLAPNHFPLNEPTHYWSISPLRFYFEHAMFEVTMVENSFFGLLENRNGSDVIFKFSLTGTF